MAWSDPGDFTSGQILTAAQMDSVREAMFFGQATFTNEAARDAAIPATGIALQEGMTAYLTASTVTAATGSITYVPTGVTTVYNGSVWVCTTPVAAKSETSGTRANTAYATTLTGDATAISCTLVTGTSALIQMTARLSNSSGGETVWTTVSVSGATTIAAADVNGFNLYELGLGQVVHRTLVLGGLTAGTNTFTMNYRNTSGTATWAVRDFVVTGIA